MTEVFLIDTGPLVALLNKKDVHHSWAQQSISGLAAPLFSCEPVLTEACFLLQRVPGGFAALSELVRRKVVTVPFQIESEWESLASLMVKYENVPMSLADACLVRMAELFVGAMVVTLDRDFLLYRKNRNQRIPLLVPDRA